jgi:branched-chain amino acid transport system permease protein
VEVQLLISGLQNGAVYALVGLGYATVLNATGVLNFAQGDFLMIGALLLVWSTQAHLPYPIAILVAVAGVVLVAVAAEILLIRRLQERHGSAFSMVMVLVAAMIVLEQGAGALFGKNEKAVESPFGSQPLPLGDSVLVLPHTIYLVVTVVAVFGLLFYFYQHTDLGKQMFAVGVDRAAARAIGIDVRRASLVAFALGGAVAAIGGIIFAPMAGASWSMGLPLTIKGFVAMVAGGGSRLEGPLVGGLTLGLAEVFAYSFLSPAYGSALALVVLLVILMLRPTGLLGGRTG